MNQDIRISTKVEPNVGGLQMQELYIGIDCGGTNIRVAMANELGEIIEEKIIPTNLENRSICSINDEIINLIDTMLYNSDLKTYHPKAIGMGIPCVYYNEEAMLCRNIEGLDTKYLIKYFKEKHGLPFNVLNDVKCAALGEKWIGTGKDIDNFLYVNIGTGLSLAIISNGELIQGENNAAGEIAYWIIDYDSQFSYLDGSAPLEDIFSGKGITDRYKELYAGNRGVEFGTSNYDTLNIDTKQIFEQYKLGNKEIIKLLDENVKHFFVAIANISILLNPKTIVFGGGVGQDIDVFFEKMTNYIKKVVPFPPTLTKSILGRKAGLLGAIKLAILTGNEEKKIG